jgi:hypothetical protein
MWVAQWAALKAERWVIDWVAHLAARTADERAEVSAAM